MSKVIVAMSGGVDSSACAALLKSQGYDVIGVNLWLWNRDCDAEKVCKTIDVPFVCLDRREEFRKYVIDYFIDAYFNGDTPNPCVACNKSIKFKLLLDYAEEIGADFIATGHYARVEEENGVYKLKKAIHPEKDQSYVLYNLTQSQLKRVLLPLGAFTKEEIRAIAGKTHLPVEKKKDSQDICFIPDGDYASFIRENSDKKSEVGEFVSSSGEVLGSHSGMVNYTIGQRRGLGISSASRIYVVKKENGTNRIVLGDEAELYTNEFFVRDFNFVSGIIPSEPFSASVRTRYSAHEIPCKVIPENDMLRVCLDIPARAVTNGQSAVFYDDDEVLGGGIIV